jgi:predicted dehydrogenase
MNNDTLSDWNRRDFLRNSSMASLMAMMGAMELRAEEKPKAEATDDEKPGPPVNCAVIGLGAWGREILSSLARLPNAPVLGICDTYPAFVKRSAERAPKAEKYEDYRKVLENKEVQAVIVATPTHQHREIAIAALQAGKHVYCEAPLAHTTDDAKAIAKAAKSAGKQIFQCGLLLRSNPIHNHVVGFVRTGALGKAAITRAQFHKKQSWRTPSPNPDREKELNWRLSKDTSLGLIGELGIHHVDVVAWYHKVLPVSVTGFSHLLKWQDGRDVADTIQAVLEFPAGLCMVYDATLANSFEGNCELHCGTDSAIYMRDSRAWLIKETDAPLLGWEVYARKEDFLPSKEAGIALVANSTKLLAQGKEPAEAAADSDTPLFYALKEFIANINMSKTPSAGYEAGYTATVTAIKANEAINGNKKVDLAKELFNLA